MGLILKRFRLTETVLNFFHHVASLYNETMNAFLSKNQIKACEIWFKRNELTNEADKLINNTELEYEDKDRVKNMKRIIEYCKDMADLI